MRAKEENDMKKMLLSLIFVLLLPIMVWGQDKIEAPVWKVGDKWVFTSVGIAKCGVEVLDADESSYTVKFSHCMFDRTPSQIVFEKSSLNRIYTLEGNKRKEYDWGRRRLFNFPLFEGKQWGEDTFSGRPIYNPEAPQIEYDAAETYQVLGWEDVEVPAGKFRAMKIKYFQRIIAGTSAGNAFFWYAPEVKYFVKYQNDKDCWKTGHDMELISFGLKE
jgi:hypothetical protein